MAWLCVTLERSLSHYDLDPDVVARKEQNRACVVKVGTWRADQHNVRCTPRTADNSFYCNPLGESPKILQANR